MPNVIYKGIRPVAEAGFATAKLHPDGLNTIMISKTEPYQVSLEDVTAIQMVRDFLNLAVASNQRERIRDFVSFYGFPDGAQLFPFNPDHEPIPNHFVTLSDIQESAKSFRQFYISVMGENSAGAQAAISAANKMLTAPNTAFRTITAPLTVVQMTLGENDSIVPMIIAGNIVTFCLFAVLSAMQRNSPFVTCQSCGEFYQRGATANKNAAYCSTRCRMAAHRRKKAANVTTV